MSANPQVLGQDSINASKPLKGKYDRRGKYERTEVHRKSASKPLWKKHLARNTAARLFSEISVKDQMLVLLQSKDERLRFEVLKYVWDRLEGRPFVAINPAENKQSATLHQDNRLQVAINQLVVTGKKSKQKKTQPLLPSDTTITQSDVDPQPENDKPSPTPAP